MFVSDLIFHSSSFRKSLYFSRQVLELQEAIKIKDVESEAYICEIEVPKFLFSVSKRYYYNLVQLYGFIHTRVYIHGYFSFSNNIIFWKKIYVLSSKILQTIGQAYEDMQMQNQRLLKQVTERDDYNIKACVEIAPSS